MKTGKKLLSLFLAVVMMVTTCSVGFTAFAANRDNGIWKDSTSAKSTFDALTELVDTYLPALFNQEDVKKALEEKLGMTITDTTSIQDVLEGVSPMVVTAVSSLLDGEVDSSNSTVIPAGTAFPEIAYAYLEEKDAKMTFAQLYSFCTLHKNDSDKVLADWCKDALEGTDGKIGLEALLKQYETKKAAQATALDEAYTAMGKVVDLLAAAGVNVTRDNADALHVTLADIQNATVSVNGKKYAVDDLLALADYKAAANCFDVYNGYLKAVGSDLRIRTLSEAVYYIQLEYRPQDLEKKARSGAISDAICGYFCKQVGVDPASFANSKNTNDMELAVRFGANIAANDAKYKFDLAAFFASRVTTPIVEQVKIDLAKKAPDGGNKLISSNVKYITNYVHGKYADNGIPSPFSSAFVAYFNTLSNPQKTATLNGMYRNAVGSAAVKKILAGIDEGLLKDLDPTAYGDLPSDFNASLNLFFAPLDVKTVAAQCTVKYHYSDYAIPSKVYLSAANSTINRLMVLLDENDEEGVTLNFGSTKFAITGQAVMNIVNGLLETKVDLKGALTDVYMNLYKQPVETLMKLLPILVVVIDEAIIPLALNQEGDAQYGTLAGVLSGLMEKEGQANGSPTGINALGWDLNKVLPTLMHWLIGDKNYTFTYYNVTKVYYEYDYKIKLDEDGNPVKDGDGNPVYVEKLDGDGNPVLDENGHKVYEPAETDKDGNPVYKLDDNGKKIVSSLVYGERTTGKYDASKTPVILDIYAADKALQGAKASGIADALKLTGDGATAVNEAVSELATSFTAAVDQYVAVHREDAKSGANTEADGSVYNRGANNIFVALPQILDIMGKNFIAKYDVKSADNTKKASDWSYSDYKIKSDTVGDREFFYNQSLVNFKNLANGGKPADILDCFVNIFVNDWLNAIFDLLNDVTATDNKITNNLPIITGLIRAMGGLGEKSTISDVLNGVFQLKYNDKASFVMGVYNKDSNFVGLSTKSAYFLLSNIGQLVNVIQAMDTKTKNTIDVNFPKVNGKMAKIETQPKWAKVPKTSSKSGASLLSNLDSALSKVLENSTLNNFNLNTTPGILCGLVSLGSYILGSDNTNPMLKMLNKTLNFLNDGDKKSTDTSDKKVYTEDHLTNLVVQMYVALENVIDYYLVNEDALGLNVFYDSNQKLYKKKDKAGKPVYYTSKTGAYHYNILAAALKGLISPHAVSNHLTNKSAAKKLASLPTWHNAIRLDKSTSGWTGATNIKINWGFRAGNNTKFFQNFGESLGIITDLIGVLTKDAGYYDGVLYPIFKDLEKAQGFSLGVYAKGSVKDGATGLLAILTPISKLLDGFYSKPVSVLTNLLKGLSIVMNKDLNNIATAAIRPLYKEIHGVSTILSAKVSNLMPSMAKNDAWFSAILGLIFKTNTDDKDQNAQNKQTIALVTGLLKKSATKAGLGINDVTVINAVNSQLANFGFELPTTLFKDIANCKNAEAVLKYLVNLVVDVLQIRQIIDLLKVVIDNPSMSQLLDMISRLTKKDLLNIIHAVIAKTTDPTTAYWTFLQYVQEKTTGFYYPAGVTAQDASDAVGDLDTMVTSVIGLLAGLDVVKQDNLKDLVSSLIFTNANLTKLASTLYGAIDPYKDYLGYAGIDVSKKGVAKLLTDGSYGKTYSSAAKAIKKAKSWKKLGNINWGFTDGSAKAQQGFVNGLAAILRPLDGVLSLLLAGDDLAVGQILTDLVKNLNFGSSKDTVQLKNGNLRIRIKGSDKYSKTSVLEINLYKVIEDVKSLSIYGGNGYESAIVPLLEALECPNVKTYKQYKADIKKSTDSVLTDVLNPIVGFLNKVLDAPFDTLTAVLPNVAYYIDNNGLAQLVNNLLSPVTSLLPVLKKNGVDVEVIIKALAGKSLNDLVKDALGVNIHLNLNNLNKCDIQNAIVPLVNKLLKSKKINIQLPKIDWGALANHGTVSTVKSAAKNSEGYYNRKHVTANQGETLIAVLRYVAKLLTKNISGLKSILGGIDAIKDYKSIINAVLDQIGTSSADQIIRALFYLLQENPTNAFWNYSEYQTKDYKFSYPSTVDQDFLKNIPPMLDGLIGSLADLNKLISDAAFKDSTINGMITGIGKALDGVKINDSTNLTALLSQTGIDYSTKTVAKLLTDESYGKTFANAAAVIGSASSWSKVNTSALKWGVKDKDSFFNALAAVMRPFYGVLDVLLNDASLGIFNIVHIPGSNGYSSVVVPLLEAFGCYNIKTQYQYREDISKAYDNILLDIVNSLWDKVEDILNAPLQTLMSMLPNLALFIANDGLLQLIENLFTPVSALLDALKPIVNVNTVLTQVFKAFKVDLNGLLAKVGLKLDLNIDLYDLTAMLKPIIGVDNIVPLLNQVLGMIKIKGKPLGLELMDIDWFQLASHGKVMTDASQAATYGTRVFVKGDASETLIAVLRYLVEVVNYKDNYSTVTSLVGSLIGGSDNSSITDVVGTVLNMLKGDTDDVIGELCNLLQQLGG
ncbi:MAG TPA: hypothetical protein OIM30_02195 [Oscillospiraceae bacterium]|nr:hypothetical protein [Oscillospiraceae bacterium]